MVLRQTKFFLQYCGYQLKKTRLATEKYNPMDIIIQIIRKHNFFCIVGGSEN